MAHHHESGNVAKYREQYAINSRTVFTNTTSNSEDLKLVASLKWQFLVLRLHIP